MNRPNLLSLLACLLLLAMQPALASRYAYLPDASTDSVAVVDTRDNTRVLPDIPVGSTPVAVATHPAGHVVYIANLGSDDVSVIETASNTVVATIPVGGGPYHLAVSPDGSELYVPNYNVGTISVISTASNTVVATIPGMPGANAVAFAPSGATAYVNDYNSGALYVIDTVARTATSFPVPAYGEGMAVHPSGRYVYQSSVATDLVAVFDTTTNTSTSISTGVVGGWGVAVHPDGRYYYVARNDGSVAVLRTSDNGLESNVLVDPLGVLGGISLTPSGDFAYVTDQNGSGQVYVVNTTTNQFQAAIGGPGGSILAMGTAIQRPLFGHGAIAAGQYHTCRIRADQSVDCWGRNDYGQATAPGGEFTQVVGGSAHSCGLRTDGSIACWGNPGPLMTPPLGAFVQLSSGARHACAIRSDGTAECWGTDVSGNTVAEPFADYMKIAAGSSHSCGLLGSGSISCWGRSDEGQTAALPGSFVQVITGAAFSCGLGADHIAVCWGDPTGGKTSPPPIAFARIFAQSSQACGLDFDGAVTCWGPDSQGESFAPPVVHAQVAAGRFHSCSLQALGVAQCWGGNVYNQAPQFALEHDFPVNATAGAAISPRTITLAVTNPGIRTPYAPRSPVYAISDGALPPGLSLSSGGVLSGTPSAPGVYHFTIEGEELNGFTASASLFLDIGGSDPSAPDITPTVTGLAGTNGWYRGNVVVSWTVSDNESAVTSTSNCGTVVVSTETAGQVIQCEATSAGGTASHSVTIRLDKTAPTGVPVVSNKRPLLNEVIGITANGMDAMSGVANESCDVPATDTVSLALTRVYCTITDVAGNEARRPVTYRVIYGFGGFTDTVLNPGWWNSAAMDQPITFMFRVFDANDAPVTDLTAASFASTSVACPTSVRQATPISESAPGLVHVGDGNYEFTWTTPPSPDCVRLVMELGDGDHVRRAQFRFK